MKAVIFLIAAIIGVASSRLVSPVIEKAVLSDIAQKDDNCFHCEEEGEEAEKAPWYESGVFYQIYPRSFKDSDGDGNGDLKGIKEKLSHLKELGVNGVWLSPVFKSPQADGGYDISSYVEIDPMYGTMEDMEALILEAKRLNIKLILDYVPNQKCPPNNWVSVFAGPAWTWNEKRGQFYLHQFDEKQPDLNYRNPAVLKAMKDVLRFWIEKGIDGFRVDAINHVFEDKELRDEVTWEAEGDPTNWNEIYHNYTVDSEENYAVVYDWRDYLDYYTTVNQIDPKLMMTEAYTREFDMTFRWFGDKDAGRHGAQVAFNFVFIADLNANSKNTDYDEKIKEWIGAVPEGSQANWVLGNHDQPRLATRYEKNEEVLAWDDTKNAGFSTGEKTWLPVHPDYAKVNLKAQKEAEASTFKLYQNLIKLRKLPVFKNGDYKMKAFEDTNAIGLLRHIGLDEVYAIALNLGDDETEVDLLSIEPAVKDSGYNKATLIVATNNYAMPEQNGELVPHGTVDADKFKLGGHQAVVMKLYSAGNGITVSFALLFAVILRAFF
uniref:alpha-glucosidase n=1 Tax=Culicoides sonorensis TaxID=179676 RepID=A0A336LV75_CULSO